MVTSWDGQRAVLVQRVEDHGYRAQNRDGFYRNAQVRLRPRDEPCTAQFFVSGTFQAMWDHPQQTLGWKKTLDEALPELMLMALGQHLDENEIPPASDGNEYTLRVPVDSYLFDVFRPQTIDDAALAKYVEGRIYWAWKFKQRIAELGEWEAQRLGVEREDLHQAAFPNNGALWEQTGRHGYLPLPALAAHFRETLAEPKAPDAALGPEPAERIFLCHGKEDKQSVRELYRQLVTAGFHPWLDEEDLLPGQDWDREIKRAVRRAAAVVVCLSRTSVSRSGYVQKEIKHALDVADEQPEGVIFIIPARLDDCDVPERLQNLQWVDLFEPNGYDRLLGALRTRQ